MSRTNVMLPDDLLDAIDRVAGARRRSAFLAEAAREKLAQMRFERAAGRAFGSWTDADHPDLMTDADMDRYPRRLRATTTRRLRARIRRGKGSAGYRRHHLVPARPGIRPRLGARD